MTRVLNSRYKVCCSENAKSVITNITFSILPDAGKSSIDETTSQILFLIVLSIPQNSK